MSRRGAVLCLVASLHAIALSSTYPSLVSAQPKPAPARPAPKPQAPQAPVDLITKGRTLFEDQQYEESIQALSAALLRPGSSKSDRIEIHRLLALNFITLGRKEEAESAVRGLLVLSPDYQMPQNESPRFRDFFADVRKRWEAEGRPGFVKEEKPKRPLTLAHNPPAQVDADKGVELRATMSDPDNRASTVKLHFRSGTKGEFAEVVAQVSATSVRADIPAAAVRPPVVDYYFEVLDVTGAVLLTRGDEDAPLRIAVSEPSKGWVLPVVIGGGILGAAAIVGGLALAGVFKGSSSGPSGRGPSTVSVNVGESSWR